MRHDTAQVGSHTQCLLFMSECK